MFDSSKEANAYAAKHVREIAQNIREERELDHGEGSEQASEVAIESGVAEGGLAEYCVECGRANFVKGGRHQLNGWDGGAPL